MAGERSRDLAIAPGSYVLVLDRTKGFVSTITGPSKTSMADTESLVSWDPKTGRYIEIDRPEEAVRPNVVASQGQYVVLQNPAREKANEFPQDGKTSLPPTLETGNSIIINGPVSFALWYGQSAQVIDGHKLRSNQFLVLEVTNDKQARENWDKAVVKRVSQDPLTPPTSQSTQVPSDSSGNQPPAEHPSVAPLEQKKKSAPINPSILTIGQRIIICGTDTSFFIPPSGMRVIPDAGGLFVREAVTLESLQYCVLLGEDGNKRYVEGPDVVFPTPTESFVESEGKRVFKAIELNATSGIHVMVIADYKDCNTNIRAGTELFITGKEQAIYFPRPEHAIIKYDGKNAVQHATAVPAGEGRYVLNRETGEVRLVKGPKMLLLDPRKDVFTRRVLYRKQVELWFPGNSRAIEINEALAAEVASSGSPVEDSPRASSPVRSRSMSPYGEERSMFVASDQIDRRSTYTPPRTVTLDTKFQGAVAITVWSGYAIEVVRKDGTRRVVTGPQTTLLEYDEVLTCLSLSTGKPKTTDRLAETVYLKILGNQVSDIVTVETEDGMEIQVKLGYQVEFTGDGKKWFEVDNYVKLLTDHLRSILRASARGFSVSEFLATSTTIIRDAVLGKKPEKEPRPGCVFPQVDARVYDVEVLSVKAVDPAVATMISRAQLEMVKQTLTLTQRQQELVVTKQTEEITRAIADEQAKTADANHQLAVLRQKQRLELSLKEREVDLGVRRLVHEADFALQEVLGKIESARLLREKASAEQRRAIDTELQKLGLEKVTAETEALKARFGAIPADFVRAIEASNDRDSLVKVTEQLGLAAYLRQDSVGATIQSLLAGTPLEKTFEKLGTAVRGTQPSDHR
ncbi:MAG: hypothetical protein RLZZ347_602 [Candidatus Parcubacteria bacterium]|jgi:major vault protein